MNKEQFSKLLDIERAEWEKHHEFIKTHNVLRKTLLSLYDELPREYIDKISDMSDKLHILIVTHHTFFKMSREKSRCVCE